MSADILRDFPEWWKSGSDACLLWYSGDRFLEGSVADIQKALHSPNRRSFVVVNTPCVEQVPFVTVQPRIFVKPASVDHWSFQIRIENDAMPTAPSFGNSSQQLEPWAKLVEAVSAEKAKPGAGVEQLLAIWESRDKLPDIIGALAMRNLVGADAPASGNCECSEVSGGWREALSDLRGSALSRGVARCPRATFRRSIPASGAREIVWQHVAWVGR